MSDLTLLSVLRRVILDYRVIAAFVAVLLYLNFIFYVVRYKKKKKSAGKKSPIKVKSAVSAQPVSETPEETVENGTNEEMSENAEI